MANKLPSKPVPKKPAPQAFDVGVLLDGIAQEKEQREREVKLPYTYFLILVSYKITHRNVFNKNNNNASRMKNEKRRCDDVKKKSLGDSK